MTNGDPADVTDLEEPMTERTTAYWITTGLAALPLFAGGLGNFVHAEPAVESITALGYPEYVLTILGFWKVLGAIVLVAPGLPRVKEWAYVGIALNLTGAAFSHVAVGDPAWKVIAPLVLLGLAGASWALLPADRSLPSVAGIFAARRSQTA